MRETCARVLAAALMTGAIAFALGAPALFESPRDESRALTAPPSSLQRSVRVPAPSAPARPVRAERLVAALSVRPPATRPAVVRIEPSHAAVRAPRSKPRPATGGRSPAPAPQPPPEPGTRELTSTTPEPALPAPTPTPTASAPAAEEDGDGKHKPKRKGKAKGKAQVQETGPVAEVPAAVSPAEITPVAPAAQPEQEADGKEHGPGKDKGHGHGHRD
jgi:hypothetical protein